MRKRVASHFGAGGNSAMTAEVASIDCVIVGSEAEALLAEQSFIKQYRPRFNIRLRDDKSYPFIGVSLDEDFPRVYFTRERHRRDRAYFGPYSNAKRVRETLELLSRIFLIRSCTGTEPGRRSGLAVPRLPHPPLRGALRRLRLARGVPPRHRPRDRVPRRPLRPDRARARGAHERRRRGAGVRAGGGRAQPPSRGALAARAPARRGLHGRHARRDRRRARGHRRQRAGLPGPRRRALRSPVLLPRQRGGAASRSR